MNPPCVACGMSLHDCLDAIPYGGDGDPGVCCADCDHSEERAA